MFAEAESALVTAKTQTHLLDVRILQKCLQRCRENGSFLLALQIKQGCSTIRNRELNSRHRVWCLAAQRWFPLAVQTHDVPLQPAGSGKLGDLQPDGFGSEYARLMPR